jgi:hypothetical protein
VDKWQILAAGLTSVLLLVQAGSVALVERYASGFGDNLLARTVRRPVVLWGLTGVSSVAWLTPFLLLFLLDLFIPFSFILPQLG